MLSVAPVIAFTLAMAFGVRPLDAGAALESPKRHVRCTSDTLRELVKTGFHRSPTFASLLTRLEYSDVIVYIESVPRLPEALEGRLLMLPRAHGFRYVRIQVALRGSSNDTIALIGHELQHAVEVAESADVNDEMSLAAMYKRTGIDHGRNVYDSEAAQEMGRRVLRELVA